jgi:hypothetical protein
MRTTCMIIPLGKTGLSHYILLSKLRCVSGEEANFPKNCII